MKYLIYTIDGLPTVKAFSEHLSHADEHAGFMWVHRARKGDIKLESAGFYNTFARIDTEAEWAFLKVEAFGFSESLNVHSRPEDASIIQMALEMESTATPRRAA